MSKTRLQSRARPQAPSSPVSLFRDRPFAARSVPPVPSPDPAPLSWVARMPASPMTIVAPSEAPSPQIGLGGIASPVSPVTEYPADSIVQRGRRKRSESSDEDNPPRKKRRIKKDEEDDDTSDGEWLPRSHRKSVTSKKKRRRSDSKEEEQPKRKRKRVIAGKKSARDVEEGSSDQEKEQAPPKKRSKPGPDLVIDNGVIPDEEVGSKGETGIVVNVPTPAVGKDLSPLALAELYAEQARNQTAELRNQMCMVIGLNRKWSDDDNVREQTGRELIRIAREIRGFKAFPITVFVFFLDTDTSEFQADVREKVLRHPATAAYAAALRKINKNVYIEITDPDNTRLKIDPKNAKEPGRHDRVDELVKGAGEEPPLLIGAPYWGETPHPLGQYALTADMRTREAMAHVSPLLPYISEQSIFLESNAALAKGVSFGTGRDEYPHIRNSLRETQKLDRDAFADKIVYDPKMFVDTDMQRFGAGFSKHGKWVEDPRSMLHNTLLQSHAGWRTFLKRGNQAYGAKMNQGQLLHAASQFGLPIARGQGNADFFANATNPLGTATWQQEQLRTATEYQHQESSFAAVFKKYKKRGNQWRKLLEILGRELRTGGGGLIDEVDFRIEKARKRGKASVPEERPKADPDEVSKALKVLKKPDLMAEDTRYVSVPLLTELLKDSPLQTRIVQFFLGFNAWLRARNQKTEGVEGRLSERLLAQQPWIDDKDSRVGWAREAAQVAELTHAESSLSTEQTVSLVASSIASGEAQSEVMQYYLDVIGSDAEPFWEKDIPLGVLEGVEEPEKLVEDEEEEEITPEMLAAIQVLEVRAKKKKAKAKAKKEPRKKPTQKKIPSGSKIEKAHRPAQDRVQLPGGREKQVHEIRGAAGDSVLLAAIRARGLRMTPAELRADLQQQYLKVGLAQDEVLTEIRQEIRLHWVGLTRRAVQRRKTSPKWEGSVGTRTVLDLDVELPGVAQPLQIAFMRCLLAEDPSAEFDQYVSSDQAALDYIAGVGMPGQWLTTTDIRMLGSLLDARFEVHTQLEGEDLFSETIGQEQSRHTIDLLNRHDHFDLLESSEERAGHARDFAPIPEQTSLSGSRRRDESLYKPGSGTSEPSSSNSSGKSPKDKQNVLRKRLEREGIPNAGNTCYIASVLQMIAATPVYRQVFEAESPDVDTQRLIDLGTNLLRKIDAQYAPQPQEQEPVGAVTAQEIREFRDQLVICGWPHGGEEELAEQQDAGELFLFMMDLLGSGNRVDLVHDFQDRGGLAQQENVQSPTLNLSGLRAVGSQHTMEDLLGLNLNRTETEVLGGGLRDHVWTLNALPQTLTIQLLRFNFSTVLGRAFKLRERVLTGREITIPARHAPGNLAVTYDLTSLVSHQGGSPATGHYVSYVRRGDHWYLANDRALDQVSDEEVDQAAQSAYLYTYARRG